MRAIIYYRPQALSFSLPSPPILLHLSRTHTHKTFARNVHYRKLLEALDLREKDDKRVAKYFWRLDFVVEGRAEGVGVRQGHSEERSPRRLTILNR